MRFSIPVLTRQAIRLGCVAILVAGCGRVEPDRGGGTAPPVVDLPEILLGGDPWGPWQAEPIVLNPAIVLAVDRACRASMQPFPAAPLVVVDARGEGLVQAHFADAAGAIATCMDMTLDRDGTVRAMGGGSTGQGGEPLPVLGLFDLDTFGSMGSSGGPNGEMTRSVTNGRAGQGIASVVIDVPGKGRITASLANGWYLAGFPGAWPEGTRVRGLDITGAAVADTFP